MNMELMRQMVQLALSKKTISQKAVYFLQGFMFGPFLLKEHAKQNKEGRRVSEISQTGDDIYPLF